MSERDDDVFDFSDQIFHEPSSSDEEKKKEEPVDRETEIQTSYLLVNALLNLLVRKGIIYPHEVNAIVAELHQEYMKKRGK